MTLPVRLSDGGFVTTYECRDDKDRPVYALQVRALTPKRVKAATFLTGVTTLATLGAGQIAVQATGTENAGAYIIALIGAALTSPLQKLGWRHLLHKHTELQIDPEFFAVKTRKGWKPYPHKQVGNFSRIAHTKAQKEARQIEFKQREATRKGQTYKPEFVYIDSFHLSFLNFQSPVKFMDVYGADAADDILGEIKSFIALTEGQRGYGRGVTAKTEDDWADDTGTLPQAEQKEWGFLPASGNEDESAQLDLRGLKLIEGGKDDDE